MRRNVIILVLFRSPVPVDQRPRLEDAQEHAYLGQVGAGRLPPADQLPWLVTEEDAPQQLLPLPDSLPVDPDDAELKVLSQFLVCES